MDEIIIKSDRDLTSEIDNKNCLSKKLTEHFALHNTCNLNINPELPGMTARKFDYLKQIDLNDYYKTGLTKRTVHCKICELDISVSKVFEHTISTGHKYNKLFVRILQKVSTNRDIDFIVLNINWLQCRYCGTMIINKHSHDLIDTHICGEAHILAKEYCLNDFIIRQYGNSPGQRDLLKPVDVLLSDVADSGEMKMKKVGASKAQSPRITLLPENRNNFILEPSGSTVTNELLDTEEPLAYIDRLLMKKSDSCRVCCEILYEYKIIKASNMEQANKKKQIEKSKQSVKNKKKLITHESSTQIIKPRTDLGGTRKKRLPKNQVIKPKTHSVGACQEKSSKTQIIVPRTHFDGVRQDLIWPALKATNRNIETNEHKDGLLASEFKKPDKNQKKKKVSTCKKMKKPAKGYTTTIHQANDCELPRLSSVKDVSVLKDHGKVTPDREKNIQGNVKDTKRVKNFSKLMGLPQKKKRPKPQSREYAFMTLKPRRAYIYKVNSKKEAKFNMQEKIRASRDNFFCGVCCKSVPNSKYYIHNHMKGAKHSGRMLNGFNDEILHLHPPRKYNSKQAIKRLRYEDFLEVFCM